ncbi:MAG: YHYH protein [Planctomycetota bacterium]
MNAAIACLAVITAPCLAVAHPDHASESDQPQRRRPPRQSAPAELPPSAVSITVEGDHRVIRANGLPEHETGAFPNPGNPNALRAQQHVYRIPANPQIADALTTARPEFGIAINGVIFDAGTAEFWSPSGRRFGARSDWNHEAIGGSLDLGLDEHNAHVQPTGKYHYHGPPAGLIAELDSGDAMTLIGWGFDGFPIYAARGHADPNDPDSPLMTLTPSYRPKQGERPAPPDGPGGAFDGSYTADWEYVQGLGDLDEANGRHGVTPEFPDGTYYYVVTGEFPYVPRFWRGTPDESLTRRGPNRGAGRGERQRPGRSPR